jgi:hypothetical protein
MPMAIELRRQPMRLTHMASRRIVLGNLRRGSWAAWKRDRQKLGTGFASDRAPKYELAHELIAKPLTL